MLVINALLKGIQFINTSNKLEENSNENSSMSSKETFVKNFARQVL